MDGEPKKPVKPLAAWLRAETSPWLGASTSSAVGAGRESNYKRNHARHRDPQVNVSMGNKNRACIVTSCSLSLCRNRPALRHGRLLEPPLPLDSILPTLAGGKATARLCCAPRRWGRLSEAIVKATRRPAPGAVIALHDEIVTGA